MATCTATVCGTGGWTGPLPGDPDNNITLSAYPSFGGITVRWSYPTTNPHAVSHVLIYRGTSALFESANQIAVQSGNTYFDPQNNTTRWYYWIRVVSVNGTQGDLIGPASAVANGLSQDILEQLTGEIDAGKLAQSLKEELALIPFLQNALLKEIFDRETGEMSLAQAIQDANNGVAQAMTFIGQVNSSRIADNSAMAATLAATAAVLQNGIAAVTEEVQVEVTRLGNQITAESNARQQAITQLDNKYAVITNDANTRITSVDGRISTEILNRQQAITNVGNRITGVQQDVSVLANELDNVYESMWTVRLQAGDLIGGFGLYNNSVIVEAGFDVDRFWVGRTVNKVKPFIIDGGVVYMDKARIRNADIDTLKIAGEAVTSINVMNAGGTWVDGSGNWHQIGSVSINTGTANPSGLLCKIFFEFASGSDCSAYFLLRHNGPINNEWGAALSMLGGFANSTTLERVALYPGAGVHTFTVFARAATSGPAAFVPFQISNASLTIHGAKR